MSSKFSAAEQSRQESADYLPVQIGINKELDGHIHYEERRPSKLYEDIAYCYWSLRSLKILEKDFIYTVMPDACVDIVFDVNSMTDPIIMTPHVEVESINLQKNFHYIGIRFRPGVIRGAINIKQVIGKQQKLSDIANLHIDGGDAFSIDEWHSNLEEMVSVLYRNGFIGKNKFISEIVRCMQYGLSVEKIAVMMGYSSRQLRRKVVEQTGFTPIQLRRVLRFQSAISSGDVSLRFADQSHLIKEFKSVTGVSYKTFVDTFK